MSPSEPFSTGKIEKLYSLLQDGLRKSDLPNEPTQQVIEKQGKSLVANFIADLRKRVEAISDMIMRRVQPDWTKSSEQVLEATGRRQYTDAAVVKTMTRGSGESVDVHFFKVGRYFTDDEQEKELELRGLVAADAYSLCKVNEDDPEFAKQHPNQTHWKDANGNWCYCAFGQWDGGPSVYVRRYDNEWGGHWWVAGVSKVS